MKTENRLEKEARKTEVEMLGIEILSLKGEYREQAMKVYRRLWSVESVDELTYLARV